MEANPYERPTSQENDVGRGKDSSQEQKFMEGKVPRFQGPKVRNCIDDNTKLLTLSKFKKKWNRI